MRLLLIRFLINVGLAIFKAGTNLAERWGLDAEIWVETDDLWPKDEGSGWHIGDEEKPL